MPGAPSPDLIAEMVARAAELRARIAREIARSEQLRLQAEIEVGRAIESVARHRAVTIADSE